MNLKYLLIVIVLFTMVSCSKKKNEELAKLKAEVETLKGENAKLKAGEKKLKASIENYNKFLKEIEKNLSEIDKSKDMLAKLNQEVKDGGEDVNEKIKEHISNIKALVENSRLKVLMMDKNLNQLRRESADKSQEILGLDNQLKSLTNELLSRNIELEEMEDLYDVEKLFANELKAIIERAYYVSDTEKNLKTMGLIEKEGGFIGLGRVKIVRSNVPDSLFTQINKVETTEIILKGRKSELISQHPEGSYQIIETKDKSDKLVISDPDAFWKSGNYLVVQVSK